MKTWIGKTWIGKKWTVKTWTVKTWIGRVDLVEPGQDSLGLSMVSEGSMA